MEPAATSHPNAAAPRPFQARLPLPLLEALMVVSWSSGFVGMRFSVDYAPVFLVVFWRCIVIAVCLLPFAFREIRRAPRDVLIRQGMIGLLAMAAYLAGVSKGIELGVPAGLSALIADLLPVGTAVLSACVMRVRPGVKVWLGLGIGCAGVLMVTHDALHIGRAPWWAYGLPFAGMLALAVATLWQQASSERFSLSAVSAMWLQSCVSAGVFAVLQGWHGGLMPVASVPFAVSVVWSAGLSTIGGYGLYWLCLRLSSPTRVSSVLFLSPSVTLLWAWFMFGEPLSWGILAGAAVSGVGVLMVIRQQGEGIGRQKPPESTL
jgi:drug/metabolite transporter (DMT)-like permease